MHTDSCGLNPDPSAPAYGGSAPADGKIEIKTHRPDVERQIEGFERVMRESPLGHLLGDLRRDLNPGNRHWEGTKEVVAIGGSAVKVTLFRKW